MAFYSANSFTVWYCIQVTKRRGKLPEIFTISKIQENFSLTNKLVDSYFSTLSSVPAVPLLSLRTGHFTMPCPSTVDTCSKHSSVLASDVSRAQCADQEAATGLQWRHLSPSPTRSLKMMVGCVRPLKNSPLNICCHLHSCLLLTPMLLFNYVCIYKYIYIAGYRCVSMKPSLTP